MTILEQNAGSGRKNAYVCERPHKLPGLPYPGCRRFIVTVDRDEGVTPFMVRCGHCGEPAYSKFYQVDLRLEPTHEWFKPETLDGLSDGERDHVERGGLLLRPIEGRGVWLRPEAIYLPQLIRQACASVAA